MTVLDLVSVLSSLARRSKGPAAEFPAGFPGVQDYFTPEDFQRAAELKGKPEPRPLIPALPGVIRLSFEAEGRLWTIDS